MLFYLIRSTEHNWVGISQLVKFSACKIDSLTLIFCCCVPECGNLVTGIFRKCRSLKRQSQKPTTNCIALEQPIRLFLPGIAVMKVFIKDYLTSKQDPFFLHREF